jgi:hypothetical protein
LLLSCPGLSALLLQLINQFSSSNGVLLDEDGFHGLGFTEPKLSGNPCRGPVHAVHAVLGYDNLNNLTSEDRDDTVLLSFG